MSEQRGTGTGTNSRPLNDTLAETGPGMPDDAVGPGELAPGEGGLDADAQAEALRRDGWTGETADSDEPEAHPS